MYFSNMNYEFESTIQLRFRFNFLFQFRVSFFPAITEYIMIVWFSLYVFWSFQLKPQAPRYHLLVKGQICGYNICVSGPSWGASRCAENMQSMKRHTRKESQVEKGLELAITQYCDTVGSQKWSQMVNLTPLCNQKTFVVPNENTFQCIERDLVFAANPTFVYQGQHLLIVLYWLKFIKT